MLPQEKKTITLMGFHKFSTRRHLSPFETIGHSFPTGFISTIGTWKKQQIHGTLGNFLDRLDPWHHRCHMKGFHVRFPIFLIGWLSISSFCFPHKRNRPSSFQEVSSRPETSSRPKVYCEKTVFSRRFPSFKPNFPLFQGVSYSNCHMKPPKIIQKIITGTLPPSAT